MHSSPWQATGDSAKGFAKMQVVGVYLFFEEEINPNMGAARAQIVYSLPAKYNEKKYTSIMKKSRYGNFIWNRKRYREMEEGEY